MKVLYFIIIIVFVVPFVSMGQENANKIIKKYAEATGGLKNWKKIHNVKDSSISYSAKDIYSNIQIDTTNLKYLVLYTESSGKYHDLVYRGLMQDLFLVSITTQDNINLYQYNFFRGTRQPLHIEKSTTTFKDAYISELFRILDAKKVEYIGEEAENNEVYEKLRVSEKTGHITVWYFNQKNSLLEKINVGEDNIRFSTYYKDYQDINGFLVPMRTETQNEAGNTVIMINKISKEFNVKVPKNCYTLE
jgi:hypothetical protein